MLTLAFNMSIVKMDGTVYTRPTGKEDPPYAPIERDGTIYTCARHGRNHFGETYP